MKLLACVFALAGLLLAQPPRLAAFLWHESPNDLATLAGIEKGLVAAGLRPEVARFAAHGDAEAAKRELARLAAGGFDLVFALGTQSALLTRDAILDRPVIYSAVTDPVASGVVKGWDGSGSHLAGVSNAIPPETVLHVFQRAVPQLARLGILRSRTAGVVSAAELARMRAHLTTKGAPALTVVEALTDDAQGIAQAVQELVAQQVQAIWIPIDIVIYQNLAQVRAALGKARVPLLSSSLQGARSGAVAGVLVDYELLGECTAALALEVLAGKRKPGTIPTVTLRSYQVVVNLAAARDLGYELPLSLLALADVLLDEAPGGRDGKR